mmetsp:Transcript_21447/g.57173  ORF Transcript_21447/g.57173 Transcript_21447/m.57173 type:complete len:81 (-) Transcript_21447:139-381(-)
MTGLNNRGKRTTHPSATHDQTTLTEEKKNCRLTSMNLAGDHDRVGQPFPSFFRDEPLHLLWPLSARKTHDTTRSETQSRK